MAPFTHASVIGNRSTGSHRVRRTQVSAETWTRHRKLRKKIASAKWYVSKKQREIRQQHTHRQILDANLRDLHHPEAPWNQIHRLYEWAHWPATLRDYSQLLSVPQHPHAPCLTAIRYQIETVTRPLMDSIWRNIPWSHPSFQERLIQLAWREHRQRHLCLDARDHPPSGAATTVPDTPWPVSDVPHPCSSGSCTSTCAWHTASMASVPGVLFVALTMGYPHLPHPELTQIWRWLAQSLVHIYHPNNPKDIQPHTIDVHPDTNTHQPPNQTPIQKLQHIALQHTLILNPRSILCDWIQSHCFPSMDIPRSSGVGDLHSFWWWDDHNDSGFRPLTQPPSPVRSPTPADSYDDLWNNIRASDCESSQSSEPSTVVEDWIQRSLDTEAYDHRNPFPLSDSTLSAEWPTHSQCAAPGTPPTPIPGSPRGISTPSPIEWDPQLLSVSDSNDGGIL